MGKPNLNAGDQLENMLISKGFKIEENDGAGQMCFGDPKQQNITTGKVEIPNARFYYGNTDQDALKIK